MLHNNKLYHASPRAELAVAAHVPVVRLIIIIIIIVYNNNKSYHASPRAELAVAAHVPVVLARGEVPGRERERYI